MKCYSSARVLLDLNCMALGGFFLAAAPAAAQSINCPITSTHTDASFTVGSYVVQAGFQQSEIAAASYVLTAADFPFRIESTEMIFGTSGSTIPTTTRFSILVWQGTPATGTLIATRSSDGTTLPHIVLAAATNGANAALVINPGAPNQIIVTDSASHTFSVGYRIDQHNSPAPNPCTGTPPVCCNAYPITDTSGVSLLSGNWLFGVNCGAASCPPGGGWASFQQLPIACRPTGDWVLRARRCPLVPPDFDQDGDVDADDFNTFASCASRSHVTHSGSPACLAADADHDTDVDSDDFGHFQRCYSGMNNRADPDCKG